MDITKDETVSHCTGIADTMLRFIQNEGANTFPSVLAIINRFFLSVEDYDWQEKSGISGVKLLKAGDDFHWYKVWPGDLYSANFQPSIHTTILPNTSLFTTNNLPNVIRDTTKYFQTKNGHYFFAGTLLYSNNVNDYEKASNTGVNDQPFDVLTYNEYDFFLTKNTLYRVKNGIGTAVYIAKADGTTPADVFSAFELIGSTIIIASSEGGVKISNITDSQVVDTLIRPKTKEFDRWGYDDEDSDADDDSSSSGGLGYRYTVTKRNHIMKNSTFVYNAGGGKYVIGNTKDSSKWDENESKWEAFDDDVDEDINTEEVKYEKTIHLNTESCIINEGKTTYKKREYDKIANAFTESDGIVYLSYNGGVAVYKGSETTPIYEMKGSNSVSGDVVFFVITDNMVFIRDSAVKRSYTITDEDNPLLFYTIAFTYKTDINKEELDIRKAFCSIRDLIAMTANRAKFDECFGTAKTGQSTYIVQYSVQGGKTVWNIFGNDDRKREAEEMKQCANYFDISVG